MASRAERKADVVARDLLARIVAGEHPVGSLLPREAELAAAYGVNRSVVREAVKLLEVHRLVRPTRRLGTVVTDPKASLTPEVLHAMLVSQSASGLRVDVAVLEGLLEIRAGLDAQMAELAAKRRMDDDLAALHAAIASAEGAAADRDAFARALVDFALALARATQNPVFEMLAHWNASITTELDVVFGALRTATGPHLDGLRVLTLAVREGNAAGARDLVLAFHAWATPRLVLQARLVNGEAPAIDPARRARPPKRDRRSHP